MQNTTSPTPTLTTGVRRFELDGRQFRVLRTTEMARNVTGFLCRDNRTSRTFVVDAETGETVVEECLGFDAEQLTREALA